ncbi:MAG: hypothetical protein ACRDTU_19510, partial [Micromonosporaceae bacterium]
SLTNTREVSAGVGVLPGTITVGPVKIRLPNWLGKLRWRYGRGIRSGSVVNNVELLESHDTALSYQFGYDLDARIHERGEQIAQVDVPDQSVVLKLLDDVSSDTPQTLPPHDFDAPRERPDGYRSIFQRVGYVVTDTIATSNLSDAFRRVLPATLTTPGKAPWSLARAFGNVENVRSHVEQISDGLYTIDHLFKEGWVRDDHGQLELGLNLGKPRYRARTGPSFVSGKINFGMDRAGHSSSDGSGWESSWQALGVEGDVAGAPGGQPGVAFSESSTRQGTRWRGTDSAVERLSLHFGRMYQFSADALFAVKGLGVKRNRLVDGSDAPRVEYVEEPDGYWFWIRESDMLRLHLEDGLDVPDPVVEEALWADQNGPRDLPIGTVTALLDRFAAGRLALSTDTVATVLGRHFAGDLTLSPETLAGILRSQAARDLDLPVDLVDRVRAHVRLPEDVATALDNRWMPTEWAMPDADQHARDLLERFLYDPERLPGSSVVADALRRYLAGNFPVDDAAIDLIVEASLGGRLDLPMDLVGRLFWERPSPRSTVEQLRDYAAGRWPMFDSEVGDALRGHLSGADALPVALVGKLAARYAAGHLSLSDDVVADLLDAYRSGSLKLPDTVAAGASRRFSGAPGLRFAVPEPDAAPAFPAKLASGAPAAPGLPEHMLGPDAAILGFGAAERIELARSLPQVIRGLLRQVAPEAVRDRSVSSVLGLLRQIGDQYSTPGLRALIDDLFGSGLRLAFVNPRGMVGAELVMIKLKAGPLRNPRPLGTESRAGMENYAYANHSRSTTWTNTRGRTWSARVSGGGTPGGQDPGADHLTTLAGGASHSRTDNRSVATTTADTVTSTRTVFDWSGNRDFSVDFDIIAEVTRTPVPGRPVSNVYTRGFQAAEDALRTVRQRTSRSSRAVQAVPGSMTWRLPKSLSDPAQGAHGRYGIHGDPPKGRFKLPVKYYPEGFTGLDRLLDAAQRAVGDLALQEATRNGQTVSWFVGAHAVRANLDRITQDPDGYDFSGLFEPGLVADLFQDLRVKGRLRDPVKLRDFSTMALGHYLKREQLSKSSSGAGIGRATSADLAPTTRTDTVDGASPNSDGGAHTSGVSETGGVSTALSAGQDVQRGTRDESHTKQTGRIWLVRAELDFRLVSRTWKENVLWHGTPAPREGTETTSTVYLYLFEHDAIKIFEDLEKAPPPRTRRAEQRYAPGSLAGLLRPRPGLTTTTTLPVPAVRYDRSEVVGIVAQVSATEPAGKQPERSGALTDDEFDPRCARQLHALATGLYPGGNSFTRVRASEPQDDTAVGTRGARAEQRQFASRRGWRRPASWEALEQAVPAVGGTAFIQLRRRTGPGHAFALHHSSDGLLYLDPDHLDRPVTVPAEWSAVIDGLRDGTADRDPREPDLDVVALVVDPTGREVPEAFGHAPESASIARAILDPPQRPDQIGSRRIFRLQDSDTSDGGTDAESTAADEESRDDTGFEPAMTGPPPGDWRASGYQRGWVMGVPATRERWRTLGWFDHYHSDDSMATIVLGDELVDADHASDALDRTLGVLDQNTRSESGFVVVLSGVVGVPELDQLLTRPDVADVFWVGQHSGVRVVASLRTARHVATGATPGGGFGRMESTAFIAMSHVRHMPDPRGHESVLLYGRTDSPDESGRLADVTYAALRTLGTGDADPDAPVLMSIQDTGFPGVAASLWDHPVHARNRTGWQRFLPGGGTVPLGESPWHPVLVQTRSGGLLVAADDTAPNIVTPWLDPDGSYEAVHVATPLDHRHAVPVLAEVLAQVTSHGDSSRVVVTLEGDLPRSVRSIRAVAEQLDALIRHDGVRAVLWRSPDGRTTLVPRRGMDTFDIGRTPPGELRVRAPIDDQAVVDAAIGYADPDPGRTGDLGTIALDWPGADAQ